MNRRTRQCIQIRRPRILGLLRELTLSRLLAFLLFAGLVIVLVETCQKKIIVEPFGVPKKLADMGYTPRVVAQHIIDNIHMIHETAKLAMVIEILGAWESSELDVEISTTGLSIKSIASYLRTLLPIERTVITGELLQSSSTGAVSLRVRGNGRRLTENFEQCWDSTSDRNEPMPSLFLDGAAKVMAATDPYILATYYYRVLTRYPRNSRAHDHYKSNVDKLLPIIFETTRLDADTRYRATILQGHLFLDHKDQPEAAIAKYEEAVRLAPHRALAYVNLGVAYANQNGNRKEPRRAIWYLMRAIDIDSDLAAEAYTIWGEILYNQAGSGRFDSTLYEGAIAKHEEAIKLEPNYARAYQGRGLANYMLWRCSKSMADYETAVEIPDYAREYMLERCSKSMADYETAIEIDPDYGRVYFKYGQLLFGMHRYVEAIEQYKKATEIEPYYSKAYKGWTDALVGLYDGKHTDTQLIRERAQGDVAWGNALAKAGDCRGAQERYITAIRLDGRYRQFSCEALICH